jgi:four helix bundle protein
VENKIKNFKDLKIWQRGMELAKAIYQVTDSFPAKEIYGLSSQMRRSAVSIPSNIAEGFMRKHNKEYKQFLYIALGSLAELETQVLLSEELGFFKKR